MAQTNLVTLLLLVAVTACMAFAPSTQSRASATLFAIKGLNNAYTRGGKNSWEFEREAEYVEAPKKTVQKVPVKAAAVKATAKKIPAKPVAVKTVKAAVKTIPAKAAAVKTQVKAAVKKAPVKAAAAKAQVNAAFKKPVKAAAKAIETPKKKFFGLF